MSRLIDLARQQLERANRDHPDQRSREGAHALYVAQALSLTLDALEALEELVNEHRNASDSHARLV